MAVIEKVIRIPIYGGRFKLFIYEKEQEFYDRFGQIDFDEPIDNWDGGVYEIEDKSFMVFHRYKNKNIQYPTPGIIAHECKHMVNRLFSQVGLKLDLINDEAECYLLGWMVNRVHENINKR